MALPATTKRVPEHTADPVNQRIRKKAEKRIRYFAAHPAKIEGRLRKLDREWDIERTLETNATILALIGLALGYVVNPTWYLLPLFVLGFLLQHALQGWCPPLPVFRRIGVRTRKEIEQERYALKALRGDFDNLRHETQPVAEVLRIIYK